MIKAKGVLYKSTRVYDNQLGSWIQSYLKKKNVNIDPMASALLSESIGDNISRLVSEIDKLLVVKTPDKSLITAQMVQENIGIHRDFNIFEFQKALGFKNAEKAYQIADYFAKNSKNNSIIYSITRVFDYFLRLIKYHNISDKSERNLAAELGVSIYFVKEYSRAAGNYPMSKLLKIVSYLREADAKAKGVGNAGIDDTDLYKELIFKILH